MPSHKPLKSVSHNFSHSFISLMNYINGDYFLGHLLKQARATNINRLTVDILKNKAEPKELLNKSISDSIGYWNKWFPTLIANSGTTMEYVKSAILVIEFDLLTNRQHHNNTRFTESPFNCTITIIDDRGKEYTRTHTGWWYPEI